MVFLTACARLPAFVVSMYLFILMSYKLIYLIIQFRPEKQKKMYNLMIGPDIFLDNPNMYRYASSCGYSTTVVGVMLSHKWWYTCSDCTFVATYIVCTSLVTLPELYIGWHSCFLTFPSPLTSEVVHQKAIHSFESIELLC